MSNKAYQRLTFYAIVALFGVPLVMRPLFYLAWLGVAVVLGELLWVYQCRSSPNTSKSD